MRMILSIPIRLRKVRKQREQPDRCMLQLASSAQEKRSQAETDMSGWKHPCTEYAFRLVKCHESSTQTADPYWSPSSTIAGCPINICLQSIADRWVVTVCFAMRSFQKAFTHGHGCHETAKRCSGLSGLSAHSSMRWVWSTIDASAAWTNAWAAAYISSTRELPDRSWDNWPSVFA